MARAYAQSFAGLTAGGIPTLVAGLPSGGRLLDDSHAPSWWVYADPDGNEACICTTFGREDQ